MAPEGEGIWKDADMCIPAQGTGSSIGSTFHVDPSPWYVVGIKLSHFLPFSVCGLQGRGKHGWVLLFTAFLQ